MLSRHEEHRSDLVLVQTTSPVAQRVDCEQLFALMTQHLSFVVETRRASKLYSHLQRWQEDPSAIPLDLLQAEGLRWLQGVARHSVLPAIDYLVQLYQGCIDKAAQTALRRYLRLRVSLRGNAEDLYALAMHLTDAQTGLRKNYREASDCLRIATQLGHPKSHILLAQMYQRGAGVERSHDRYLYHLEQAAQAGLVEAQIALARAYGQEGLFAQMERVEYWLSKALLQNAPEACYLLGKLWYHQDGDCYTSRVIALWQQAADAEIPEACYEVGRMLLIDSEQASRRSEGIRYLCQAAQAGIYQARQLLYRHHYDVSGRYIGVLREPISDYTAVEQTLF